MSVYMNIYIFTVCVCGKSMWAGASFAKHGACAVRMGAADADMQPAPRLCTFKLCRKQKA